MMFVQKFDLTEATEPFFVKGPNVIWAEFIQTECRSAILFSSDKMTKGVDLSFSSVVVTFEEKRRISINEKWLSSLGPVP
jgi:hypothetical protein